MRTLSLLIACCLATPALADIYKCRLPDGKTEISSTPCPSGSATVTARPSEPVSESSRQQAERDVERMREYVERREAAQRAEERSERQERNSQRQAAASQRTYGDPDACLRELDQQVLEATQRAYLEAECRRLVRPPASTVQQPVPVYVPYIPHPAPHHPPPQQRPVAPARTEPPAGLPVVICPPSNKNCR